MKNLILYTLLFCLGGMAAACYATDSLFNFRHSSPDAIGLPSAPMDFKLQRTYQSRSLHKGLFGHGWCSNLDRSLTVKQVDRIQYNDCMFDTAFRFQLVEATKEASIYKSLDAPHLHLKKEGGIYILQSSNSTLWFNTLGKFQRVQSSTENYQAIYNQEGALSHIKTSKSLYAVSLNSDLRISKIESLGALNKIEYVYRNANLTAVTSSKGRKSYKYSEFHNLTHIRENGLTRSIRYDTLNDQVKSISESNGCRQTRHHGRRRSSIHLNCGRGLTNITYDQFGRLIGFSKRGLGKALISYDAQSNIESIVYTNREHQERRYTLNEIPAQARGDTELDTLLILASEATQAI